MRKGIKKKIIFVFIAFVAVFFIYTILKKDNEDKSKKEIEKKEVKTGKKHEIVLFFPDKDLLKVYSETAELKKNYEDKQEILKQIFTLFAKGPRTKDLINLFPEGFEFGNIYVHNKILYINVLSKHLKNCSWGSSAEMLLINSIRKTLKENTKDIKYFDILIDGENRNTFELGNGSGGHIDISSPIPVY